MSDSKKSDLKLTPQGLDLLAALDSVDVAQEKEKLRKTGIADAERLTDRSVVDDKQTQAFAKIAIMGGLKKCPVCQEQVTGMSKCSVNGRYHVDLI